MNEEKQIYDDLLKNVDNIISHLNDIYFKIDDLSSDFNGKYMIDDMYGDYSVIDKSKTSIENIKLFLENEVKNAVVENINQINNRF